MGQLEHDLLKKILAAQIETNQLLNRLIESTEKGGVEVEYSDQKQSRSKNTREHVKDNDVTRNKR